MAGEAPLDTVEIETVESPAASILWLHGLGADAHDFEPIVPDLAAAGVRARFVFPNAPVRPITINGGFPMRAWFDIRGPDGPPDEPAVRASDRAVRALIEREKSRGVAPERIVLAGFSQGGAMAVFTGARHPERLAGIIGLSCFDPLPGTLGREHHEANASTPILLAHGTQDPIVPLPMALSLCTELESHGHRVEWLEYPIPHTVSMEEVQAIGAWLRRVLHGTG